MNIPNYENIKFVERDGNLTESWSNILQALITALQMNVSQEGFHIPQQSTTNINNLQTQFNASSNPADYYGVMLYDSTTDQLKVNIAGTFKVVTVT